MKLLIISATDNKGIALAEALSAHHDVTFMHDTEVDIESVFDECILDEDALMNCPFEKYRGVIYLASEALSCQYLTILLKALQSAPETVCICLRECGINLSAENYVYPEKYICMGFSQLLRNRLFFWQTVPVYGDDFLPSELMVEIEKREHKNQINLPGAQEDTFEVIHVSDLSAALDIFINDNSHFSDIYLSSNQQTTMRELGAALSGIFSQTEILYTGNSVPAANIQMPNNPEGWMPNHLFFKDLPTVINKIEDEGHELLRYEKSNRMKRITRFATFILLFVLICVYTSVVRTNSELQYIDFRLLFVVIASVFWGMQYGLMAAILSSITAVTQSILGGTKWYVIFFHIDNWIPVATYFVTSILLGMYHDSHSKAEDELRDFPK